MKTLGANSEKDSAVYYVCDERQRVTWAGIGLTGVPKFPVEMVMAPPGAPAWLHAVTVASATTS